MKSEAEMSERRWGRRTENVGSERWSGWEGRINRSSLCQKVSKKCGSGCKRKWSARSRYILLEMQSSRPK